MGGFRFLFMADCQLGCYATFSGLGTQELADLARRGMQAAPAPATTGWEWDARRYADALEAARGLRPDHVIMGGDMVDDPASAGQYEDLMRLTARLGRIPMHWVTGNHDAADDRVVPTAASLARYRARFGADHYAFTHRDTAFVVVDTVVWDHPEHVPDELEAQLEWLDRELGSLRESGPDHILVFGHHPLFTHDPDEPDSYWNVPRARRHRILDLLRHHRVRAYFCGHWHRNGGTHVGDLEQVITGPVGYPLGDDPSGFRVVDVAPDGIEHRYVSLDAHVPGAV